MGAVRVYNLTSIRQYFGPYNVPPGEWAELPYTLAAQLAGTVDYRAEDAALLLNYRFRDDDGTHLGWSSPFHYADGYGGAAQDIAKTFLDMGVKLSIFPRDYDPSRAQFGGFPLESWPDRAFVPHNIVDRLRQPQEQVFYGINMTWPPETDRHPFCRGIGFTMFETTAPPRHWSDAMNRARRIVVPCLQNAEAFRNQGVTVPIDVVQLGIDPDRWRYFDREKHPRRFRFLMSGGLTHRKNPVGAARAFVAAFPPNQRDVQLVLKTRGGNTVGGFYDWRHEMPDDPRIAVICEESTPAQMVAQMWEANAFIFPSRGEGFGLPPLQAMATGLPVIVSDNSGMSEYCDSRYNYPIPCTEVPVPRPPAPGGYPPHWGEVGNWWEPDFDALVETMRSVYANQGAALKKGGKAAEWARDRWTVRDTCEGILRVVRADAEESGVQWSTE
jgi:glycosyltransferase involved in cell wall biosynthesis